MNILIACEESQEVTKVFRELGHDAISCDLQPCSGGHPDWHLQEDVLPLLSLRWDMLIAFPPCTHLSVSGAKHFKEKRADGRQQKAIRFFMRMAEAPIKKIAIENPIGIMSTVWRKPDQIIQPWHFGHNETKATCLWLKGLPKLRGKEMNEEEKMIIKMLLVDRVAHMPPSKERGKMRSKTYPGVARAMGEQWGGEERRDE